MKFLLLVALATVTAAAPQHGKAGYGHDAAHYDTPYSYDYAVNDPHYGAQFSKNEHSDGNNVVGEYSVVLPDGRTQHVKYTADHYGGYNAVVTYDGYAKTPAYHPAAPHHAASAYHAPKPVYHAAPVYHAPKPVYHAAPVYHAPKPVYHAAPVYHAPKPAYHPAPVHKALY